MPFHRDLFCLCLTTPAGHCRRLLSIATDSNRRQWAAVHSNGWQWVAMGGNGRQWVAMGGDGWQWVAMDINHPGYRIQDPGSWIVDPGSWILYPGSKILDLGSRILGPKSGIQDPGWLPSIAVCRNRWQLAAIDGNDQQRWLEKNENGLHEIAFRHRQFQALLRGAECHCTAYNSRRWCQHLIQWCCNTVLGSALKDLFGPKSGFLSKM